MSLPVEYREEVKSMIDAELAKHVRDSAILSAFLGAIVLALFVDGLMRMMGVVPPFLGIDVRVVESLRHFATAYMC